jgi:Tfp pilus assembly protein PilV
VSLIEALVAMAVMAFGMLGLLGLQATLRGNSDVSKQRSEAVRILQEAVERQRAFSVLDTTAGRQAYADVQSAAEVTLTRANANATFKLTQTVGDFPAAGQELQLARSKSLRLSVRWQDRNDVEQQISLNTLLSATAPELMAALALPGVAPSAQMPGGRNPGIPPSSVNQPGTGTSVFTPPGAAPGSPPWVFDNTTGFIDTSGCASNPSTCHFDQRLLSGYILFYRGNTQPTSAIAADTANRSLASNHIEGHFGVRADTSVAAGSAPGVPGTQGSCFVDSSSGPLGLAYYCAMPTAVDSTLPTSDPLANVKLWTGRATITGVDDLASSASDSRSNDARVCRYTTQVDAAVPPTRNEEHPAVYRRVTTNLLNQNFLVMTAGDNTTPFTCPTDPGNLPGNTWAHQPS